jgi:hypothetical protein
MFKGLHQPYAARQSFFQYKLIRSRDLHRGLRRWLANWYAFGLHSPSRKHMFVFMYILLHVVHNVQVVVIVVKGFRKLTGLKSPRQAVRPSFQDPQPRETHHHVSYRHQHRLVHFLGSHMHSEQ